MNLLPKALVVIASLVSASAMAQTRGSAVVVTRVEAVAAVVATPTSIPLPRPAPPRLPPRPLPSRSV